MLHCACPIATKDPMSSDATLQAEQIRLLFRFSLVGYLATLLVIFILGAMLWEDLAQRGPLRWVVSISLVTIGRYLLYKAFIQRGARDDQMGRWEKQFV